MIGEHAEAEDYRTGAKTVIVGLSKDRLRKGKNRRCDSHKNHSPQSARNLRLSDLQRRFRYGLRGNAKCQ